METTGRKRVVIVGAGFAALAAARVLGRDGRTDVAFATGGRTSRSDAAHG